MRFNIRCHALFLSRGAALSAALGVFLGWAAAPALAGVSIIQLDNNGSQMMDGVSSSGSVGVDPISSDTVLKYSLPFAGNAGDVLLFSGSTEVDILRFPGNGTVEFLSAAPTTTLAAASTAGTLSIKVASVANFIGGHSFQVSTGINSQTVIATLIGTSGATGTGIMLGSPLLLTYASGTTVYVPHNMSDIIGSLPNPVANNVQVQRVSLSGGNFQASWQPGATGIGGNAANLNVTYFFESSVALPIPEPASAATLVLGCALLLRRRRREKA